jgi:hypothetical protein
MKHILRAATAALMLAAGLGYLGVRPAAAYTVTGTNPVTIQLTKMKPVLCLDDRGDNKDNGAIVQVWTCIKGDNAQKWQVMGDGTIRHNGLCLDAVLPGLKAGTKVVLWACTGGFNQKWNTLHYRVNYDNYPITHNLVLTDPVTHPGMGVPGTPVELWENEDKTNQYWEVH